LRSGYGEVLKYGLIYDADFFEFLDQNLEKIFSKQDMPHQLSVDADLRGTSRAPLCGDPYVLEKIIARCCEIKADIVSQDEKENGVRALLNFGHSFAHVFEIETGYSAQLLHGEAVGVGMLMAAKMSQNLAMIDQSQFEIIQQHIIKSGLNFDLQKIKTVWNRQNLVSHLYKDKKTEGQNLTFILLEKIGKAVIKKSVSVENFLEVIEFFLAQ
jgi:3-dehydroquinate synthase